MSMKSLPNRRTLLLRGLQAAGLLLAAPAAALAACGDDGSKTSGETGPSSGAGTPRDFGTLALRLEWVKNVEYAGEFIADSAGYYRAGGFTGVNLIGGGLKSTGPADDVVNGKAFAGLAFTGDVATTIEHGAKIKIIGSQYQTNPFAIMSMARKPLKTPQDMIGKRIAVQPENEALWIGFLKANDIDPGKITKVEAGWDPAPLTTGAVDGWLSYITNEPNVLRLKGYDIFTFLMADFHFTPAGEVYVVTDESIAEERDKIKALLRAEIKGWKDSIDNPSLGAELAVRTYGRGLGLSIDQQVLQSRDQNQLILTDETRKNGIFTMSPQFVEANLRSLKFVGADLDAGDIFDTSIINEIYREDPGLI